MVLKMSDKNAIHIFTLQGHAWFIAAEVDVNGWVCACGDHDLVNLTPIQFSLLR